MKRYTAWVAIGATTAIVGGGAILPPATGSTDRTATHKATTHTLKFTAFAQKTKRFSRTSFGQEEVDRKAGKIVGFDVVNGTYDPATSTATGSVAFSTKGGVLYGSLKFTNGPVTTGTVTGGTGEFKGATGTIYGKNIDKAGTKTAVTIHYH